MKRSGADCLIPPPMGEGDREAVEGALPLRRRQTRGSETNGAWDMCQPYWPS